MKKVAYTSSLLMAGSLLLASATGYAGTAAPPNFSMVVTASGALTTISGSMLGLTTTDSIHYQTTGNQMSASSWVYGWDLSLTTDPVIAGTFSLTNKNAGTQTFNISLNLPVSTGFSPAQQTGSLGLTLTDTNKDGSAQLNGLSWNGRIDGVSAMPLSFALDPLICFGFGGAAGCSATMATVSSGPQPYAAGINRTMGIELGFTLNGGDTVSFTTSYEVTPVPVPAAFWLFGTALAPFMAAMRKRPAA